MDENGWVEVASGSDSDSVSLSQATIPTFQHTPSPKDTSEDQGTISNNVPNGTYWPELPTSEHGPSSYLNAYPGTKAIDLFGPRQQPNSQEAHTRMMAKRQGSMPKDAASLYEQADHKNEKVTPICSDANTKQNSFQPGYVSAPVAFPASNNPMPSQSNASYSNRALQDYSWQLMILEKQRKTMLARNAASEHGINNDGGNWPLSGNPVHSVGCNPTVNDQDLAMKHYGVSPKQGQWMESGTIDGEKQPNFVHESGTPLPNAFTFVDDDNNPKDAPPASTPNKVDKQAESITQSFGGLTQQDYQLQLMLLEQQNKKRLLMARMEQDSLPVSKPMEVFSEDDSVKESSKTLAQKDYELQLMLLEQQNKKRLLMARMEQDSSSTPLLGNVSGEYAAAKPPAPRDYETQCMPLEHKQRLLPAKMEQQKNLPQHIVLLYRIECSHPCHDDQGRVFLDHPQLTTNNTGCPIGCKHFRGHHAHQDLDNYLDDDSDGICAVVVRTLSCSSAAGPTGPHSDTRCGNALRYDDYYDSSEELDSGMSNGENAPEWKESFHFKSHFIESTMKHIAQAHFQRQGPVRPNRRRKNSNKKRPCKNQLIHGALFLFHHRSQLRHRLEVEINPGLKSQIQGLLDYIQFQYGEEFAEADDLFARGLVNRKHALKLFRPNEALIGERFGKPAAFILQEWPERIEPCHGLTYEGSHEGVQLTAWSYSSNGTAYVRASEIMCSKGVEEEPSSITALSAYPMRFATDKQREFLTSQGKKAFEVGKHSLITYTGWNAEKDRYLFKAGFKIDLAHTSHRNYMDPFLGNNDFMHGEFPPTLLRENHKPHPFDLHPVRLDVSKETEDFPYLLLGPIFNAFSLDERKWFKLLVDGVRPATQSMTAFERLVLPNETKDIVKTLVTIYTSQSQVKGGEGATIREQDDIAGGNGNALLLLFHGPPGTGKTYAAKSIAEAAGVPLYRLPCSDEPEPNAQHFIGVGQTAPRSGVEVCIQDAVQQSQKWQCILLLDDADFFLGQRCAEGKRRIPPASVLLHKLQSYNGVVILTTTHLEAFDDAFLSRMQGIVHFERLDNHGEEQVWKNAIDELKESGAEGEWELIESHFEDLAGKCLNGHQIHNVITTARQLAKHHGDQLRWEHVRKSFNLTLNLIDRTVPTLDSFESMARGKKSHKVKMRAY